MNSIFEKVNSATKIYTHSPLAEVQYNSRTYQAVGESYQGLSAMRKWAQIFAIIGMLVSTIFTLGIVFAAASFRAIFFNAVKELKLNQAIYVHYVPKPAQGNAGGQSNSQGPNGPNVGGSGNGNFNPQGPNVGPNVTGSGKLTSNGNPFVKENVVFVYGDTHVCLDQVFEILNQHISNPKPIGKIIVYRPQGRFQPDLILPLLEQYPRAIVLVATHTTSTEERDIVNKFLKDVVDHKNCMAFLHYNFWCDNLCLDDQSSDFKDFVAKLQS